MTDAYKIGVTVALTNLVSAELGKIVSGFGEADKGALAFNASMAAIGVAVVGVSAALKAGIDEARRFQNEATRFAALGFGDQVNGQAESFAKGMRTVGTSATENMALVADAMAVFKSLPHAEMAAPLMAQMKFANEAVYGQEGGARESKFMDMLKVIEFRGGLRSDEEFKTQADFVQKVINGSRNRVDATQLLNALKTGGVALAGMSNEGFYLGSEPLIQEFGGSRYGTANMSIYQNLVQMRTTQQALSELMRLGLLDASKVEINQHTGKVKWASAGAFRGADVLTKEGDLAFLEKVLLPAFANKGITSDDQIIMELGRILTNRTGSSLLSRVYQQRGTLHTQMDANRNAMDIGQLATAADQTYDGKMIELHAKWRDIMRDLGDKIMPKAVSGLGKIVDVLLWLTDHFDPDGYAKLKANDDASKADFLNHLKHPFGLGMRGSSAVPPPANSKPVTINVPVNLDGRQIAKSTTQYQLDGVAGVSSQGNSFDGRMSPLPVF